MGIHIQGKENSRFGKSTLEIIKSSIKAVDCISSVTTLVSRYSSKNKKIWSHFNMSNIQKAIKRYLRSIFLKVH